MIMSGSARMSGEAFAIARLQENPNLDYASLRALANEAGVSMAPIQYGRARRHLGLPPLKDRPEPTRAPAQPATPPPRPPFARAPQAAPPVASEDKADADAKVARPAASAKAAPAAAASASSDLVAPKRKGSAAFDFLVQELRKDGALSYGELRMRCEALGYKIAPIMYGRAKAVLGLVPVKARGTGKAAVAAAEARKPAAPMVLRQVESVAADRFTKHLADVRSLEQLVAVVKDLDAERRRLRGLLERIVTLIDEALG